MPTSDMNGNSGTYRRELVVCAPHHLRASQYTGSDVATTTYAINNDSHYVGSDVTTAIYNRSKDPRAGGPGMAMYIRGDAKTPRKRCVSAAKTCGRCCRNTCTFLISHLGLCGIVVAYAIAGGFIFRALEAPFDTHVRGELDELRAPYVRQLLELVEDMVTNRPNVSQEWTTSLTSDMDTDTNSTQDNNYTENALYSSYSHNVSTSLLNRTGNLTARLVNLTDTQEQVSKLLDEFQMSILFSMRKNGWDGKRGYNHLQEWSYTNSLLYSVTVITTIGYGHIAPRTNYGRLVTMLYALVGIPITLLCLSKVGGLLGNCFRFTYKYSCRFMICVFLPRRYRYPKRRQSSRGSSKRTGASEPLTGSTATEDGTTEKVRVPIAVSISIVAGYVFGGAVMFGIWEKDWDLWIGSYFCFITLSTIGFGDYVPGSAAGLGAWDSQEKAIICALYLAFGLAVIAMCFNLMQEEVRAKFMWLGRKLGLIDDNRET